MLSKHFIPPRVTAPRSRFFAGSAALESGRRPVSIRRARYTASALAPCESADRRQKEEPMKRLRVVAQGRWWTLIAATVLLVSNQGCHIQEVAYSCKATCPGKDAESCLWCGTENLQDALDAKGCPAQTQCTATRYGAGASSGRDALIGPFQPARPPRATTAVVVGGSLIPASSLQLREPLLQPRDGCP